MKVILSLHLMIASLPKHVREAFEYGCPSNLNRFSSMTQYLMIP